jgi:hypothetical protein
MNTSKYLHPIQYVKYLLIIFITKLLKRRFGANNIKYLYPLIINRKMYNHVKPTADNYGYIELFGNLWIYS